DNLATPRARHCELISNGRGADATAGHLTIARPKASRRCLARQGRELSTRALRIGSSHFPFPAGVPYRLLSLSNVTNPWYRTPHGLWRLHSSGSFGTFNVHEPRVLFLVFVIVIAVIWYTASWIWGRR